MLGKSVKELLASMTARELSYWLAFYSIEPFGDERADLRSAIVATTVANCFRAKAAPYKVSEFMPSFERKAKRMPVEQVQAYFIRLSMRANG